MNQHIGHGEKKPFKCEICDHSCSLKANINIHVALVHERKKPFKCKFCDYAKGNMNKITVII